jgi:hypothetical protein
MPRQRRKRRQNKSKPIQATAVMPLTLAPATQRVSRHFSASALLTSDVTGTIVASLDLGTVFSSVTDAAIMGEVYKCVRINRVDIELMPIVKMVYTTLSGNYVHCPIAIGYTPDAISPTSIFKVLDLAASVYASNDNRYRLSFTPQYKTGIVGDPLYSAYNAADLIGRFNARSDLGFAPASTTMFIVRFRFTTTWTYGG